MEREKENRARRKGGGGRTGKERQEERPPFGHGRARWPYDPPPTATPVLLSSPRYSPLRACSHISGPFRLITSEFTMP